MKIPIAIPYSPKTTTDGVTAIDAVAIKVINIDAFPDASVDDPGEATLCVTPYFNSDDPADYETVLYTEKDVVASELKGVTRENEGTAREWPSGTTIQSNISAYAWNLLRDRLLDTIIYLQEAYEDLYGLVWKFDESLHRHPAKEAPWDYHDGYLFEYSRGSNAYDRAGDEIETGDPVFVEITSRNMAYAHDRIGAYSFNESLGSLTKWNKYVNQWVTLEMADFEYSRDSGADNSAGESVLTGVPVYEEV